MLEEVCEVKSYRNQKYVRLVTKSEARFTESETRFSFTWFGLDFVLI